MTTTDDADLARLRALGFDPDAPGSSGADLLPRADDRELVTARAWLEHTAAARGLRPNDLAVQPWVLAAFQPATCDQLAELTAAAPAPAWSEIGERVAHGRTGSAPVTIVRLPSGAPAAVSALETLIAAGGQRFIILGAAGALTPSLAAGALVLPTGAIREDGTSFHYAPPGTPVGPDGELAERLLAACRAANIPVARGTVWTTDAPFREPATKAAAYAALGALAVEMEAAALFAAAQRRGVRLALLLAIADHAGDPWRPDPGSPAQTAARQRLAAVAVRVAAQG